MLVARLNVFSFSYIFEVGDESGSRLRANSHLSDDKTVAKTLSRPDGAPGFVVTLICG